MLLLVSEMCGCRMVWCFEDRTRCWPFCSQLHSCKFDSGWLDTHA